MPQDHPWYAKMVQHLQIIYMIHHVDRMKYKNYVIFSIATENALTNSTSFYDKNSQ